MDKLSITKSDDREVTITISLEMKPKGKSDLISYLSNIAVRCDLILRLYKIESQGIIIFNFRGDEAKIDELLESIKGL